MTSQAVPSPPKPPNVHQRAAMTLQAIKRIDSTCSAVMLLATHAGAYEQSSAGSSTKWSKRPIEGVAALYSCSNGKVKFLILNRLQLDCKDDVVEIDEHVVLSQTGQWLFILKEHLSDHAAAKKQPGKQQLCYGYWFMLEAEASEMVSAMQTVVNRLLLEQGADVQAILQGSTGMITGGGGGGNIDISNTNALLKHLNLGSKLSRSSESSRSPTLEPVPAVLLSSPSHAAALAPSASTGAASSVHAVLDTLGSAIASISGNKRMTEQQFNIMVAQTLKNPSQMQALFAAYERALGPH